MKPCHPTIASRGVIRVHMKPEDFDPPDIPKIKKLVFDDEIWHPLDHRIGSKRCRSFQKTWWKCIRTHWAYQNDFGPGGQNYKKYTMCIFGRHQYGTWWKNTPTGLAFQGRCCFNCNKDDPDMITHERIPE